MSREIIGRFDVIKLSILDKDGNCDESLRPQELTDKDYKKMFELMLLNRIFDDKCLKLQRQGRIGTYASTLGQEACQIGSAYAMNDSDFMFPSFRENGVFIARKMPMEMILQYWGGDERGDKIPDGINNFTVSIPVGTQTLHAVGYAWAAKLKLDKTASIVYFGDGATSEGDFHEAMNFAGVFKLPVVFICQNNQWAISMPREKQTAAKTIAQKAIAYGFEGIQVDGNDVIAVYRATKEAVEKARKGNGPTLLELYTYRMSDHTTADDASKYRNEQEVKEWKEKDPIDRLRKYMQKKSYWTPEYEKQIIETFQMKVEEAVNKYEAMPKPNPADIFNYVYRDLTPELKEQRDYLINFLRRLE